MEGMFKTAVSGFKKDEVLAYIDKRETEARQKMESLMQRLRKMTADLNEEKSKHAETAEQMEQLERELSLARERADELAKTAGTVDEDKRAAKAQLNDARFEVARLQQELAAANKERELAKAEKEKALARTADLQDTISALNDKIQNSAVNEDRIGRVMIEAQATADKIVKDASVRAGTLLSDAREQSAALLEQAHTEMQELLCKTADFRAEVTELREGTQKAFDHIDTLLGNVEHSADHIRESYQAPFAPAEQEEPPAVEERDAIASELAGASTQGETVDTGAFNFSRSEN